MTGPLRLVPFAALACLVSPPFAAATPPAMLASPPAVETVATGTETPAPATGDASIAPAPAPAPDYDPLEVDPAEPDFTLITLPTNLRLPRHKLAFRITHRFSRPLDDGTFHDLVSDFFGFDLGAQLGLGLRFGIVSGTDVAIYRLSDRTIQFLVEQSLLHGDNHPVAVSAVFTIEGQNNFGRDHSPGVQLVVSRRLGTRGAVYVVPTWIGNTNITAEDVTSDNSTLLLGLGARILLGHTMAVVGEYHPRLAGYKGDRGFGDPNSLVTFAIEKRVGGHSFQFNFSNDLATTPAVTARGQLLRASHWFIGFNISRKFY